MQQYYDVTIVSKGTLNVQPEQITWKMKIVKERRLKENFDFPKK